MTVMQDDPLSLPGKYAQEQTPVVAVFNDSLTFSRLCLGGERLRNRALCRCTLGWPRRVCGHSER